MTMVGISTITTTAVVVGLKNSQHAAPATQFVVTVASIAAVVGIVALPIVQSDTVSRRFLLSPPRLQAKRQQTYRYRWQQAFNRARGKIRENLPSTTTLILQPDDITNLAQSCLMNNNNNKENSSPTIILSIEKDQDDPRAQQEYFVFLEIQDQQEHQQQQQEQEQDQQLISSSSSIVQVPLVPFCQALSQAMEQHVFTTALCFVADASSGYSTTLLTRILEESKAGVSIIREPLWMAIVAALAEQQLLSTEHLQTVVFSLCRLDALRVTNNNNKTNKTVAFFLPGQACTGALIPLLQAVFPCERHMFAYDACVPSVLRAITTATATTTTQSPQVPHAEKHSNCFDDPVRITTPLSKKTSSSLTQSVRHLTDALAKLPLHLAEATETWMASVDAFLKLKQSSNDEYLPYVLKLSLLLQGPNTEMRRLALTNVLQFVTGSRSRPISEAVLDAAWEVLRDRIEANEQQQKQKPQALDKTHVKAIEQCVFLHHGILIQDKTLLDTVMPAKEWTLKAAKKISGCACCAPEEEEDEEDEAAVAGAFASAGTTTTTTTTARPRKERPKYVDGKMGFAFDPTAFS